MNFEFLNDWGEIILGVIGLFAAYFFWKNQSAYKELTYTVDTINVLEKGVISSKENLKVLLDDLELKELFITTVAIINSGELPINSSDFESDILVKLYDRNNDIIEPVDWQIDKTSQNDLKIEYNSDKSGMNGMLLNKNDKIRLIFFSISEPNKIIIDARISGVPQIKEVKKPNEKELERLYVKSKHIVFILYGFLFGIIVALFFGDPNQTISLRTKELSPYYWIFVLLFLIAFGFMFYPVYVLSKIRNRSK